MTTVRVWPTVCHAQDAGACMLEGRVDLVLELLAPDGAAASTGAGGIAGLEHEVGNDAMEDDVGVVVSSAKGGEVFAGFGGMGGVELEGYGTLVVVSCSERCQGDGHTIVVSSTTSVAMLNLSSSQASRCSSSLPIDQVISFPLFRNVPCTTLILAPQNPVKITSGGRSIATLLALRHQ